MTMNLDDLDLKPTAGMVAEAKRALAWRSEHGRGGTAVGIARARDIANGSRLSPDTVMRMASFFARHEVDKGGKGFKPGEDGFPSNGRIAWALWGGDAGASWSRKMAEQVKRARTASVASQRAVVSHLPLAEAQVSALRFRRALTPAELQQRKDAAKSAAEKRRRGDTTTANPLEVRRRDLRAKQLKETEQRKAAARRLRKQRREGRYLRSALKSAKHAIGHEFETAGKLVSGEHQVVPFDYRVRVGAAAFEEGKHKRDATGKFAVKSSSERARKVSERPPGWNGRCMNRGYAADNPDICGGGPAMNADKRDGAAARSDKRQAEIKAARSKGSQSAKGLAAAGRRSAKVK